MIRSDVKTSKGYTHFVASDFTGAIDGSQSNVSLSLWPDGVNNSNEPEACALISIEHDNLDGEQPEELSVLLDNKALLKLRDMLNERFPVLDKTYPRE